VQEERLRRGARGAQEEPPICDPLRRSRSQTGSGGGAFGSHATHTSRSSRGTSRKGEGASEFLLRHSGERIFYVAPWLSRLSGITMTISRLGRRVWAARKGFCAMPKMAGDQERLVWQLLGPASLAPNGP
jgi:hypothetical protein